MEENSTDANSNDTARQNSLKRKQMHDHDENNNVRLSSRPAGFSAYQLVARTSIIRM